MGGPRVSFAVDVSSHQPSHQPWTAFGVHMGIAKASEGQHSHDEWFARHLADITAAGLVPGAYHFAWPNQDVLAEAANYVAAVRPLARPGLVHVLDLEPYPDGAKNYVGRTDAQIRAWATQWVALIRAAFPGQRVLGYTPRDAYAAHFPAGTDGYWYPAYPVQGRPFAAAAALPRPAVGGVPVWGWQFTSVPRDQSVIYQSPAALRTWAAGTTPTVQEDDVPTPEELWAYKNAQAGDKHDAHQSLRNAEDAAAQALAQARANGSALSALAAKVDKLATTPTIDYAKLAAALLTAIKNGS